jgi:hypothetical protein
MAILKDGSAQTVNAEFLSLYIESVRHAVCIEQYEIALVELNRTLVILCYLINAKRNPSARQFLSAR